MLVDEPGEKHDDEADLLEGEAEDDGEIEPPLRRALVGLEGVARFELGLLDLEELGSLARTRSC